MAGGGADEEDSPTPGWVVRGDGVDEEDSPTPN